MRMPSTLFTFLVVTKSLTNGFVMNPVCNQLPRHSSSNLKLFEVESDDSTFKSATSFLTPEDIDAIGDSSYFLEEPTGDDENQLPSDTLIKLAKRFLVKSKGIGGDAELLNDDFVFEGPVVGPFGKEEFLEAISSVCFDEGFPDWTGEFYGFHVDPLEPNRVWYTAKGYGTNSGSFPTKDLPPTYKKVINTPQVCSLTFDPSSGLIKKYTIGYVADRTIGNTGGLGGLYGIMYAIGRPLPFPEAQPWKPSFAYASFQTIGRFLSKLQERKD
jgi:hypothetical protein